MPSALDAIRSRWLTSSSTGVGSCNKQWKDQSIWRSVSAYDPDLWVFAGDAYYTSSSLYSAEHSATALASIKEAQAHAAQSSDLAAMLSGLRSPMVGTYDDHDRGINDGGAAPDAPARLQLFHDFFGVPAQDPRRQRDGAYAAHVYGRGRRRVKVILLDTRFHRAPHVIPSVATIKPLAVVAALTRVLSALTGLVDLQQGPVLGERQWAWLDAQLADSAEQRIAVNLVVSSVQVFTSNPSVESWGHFPAERRRLLRLLARHDPSGLVLLSGDVHVGEALSADPERLRPVEVTSSGLTHDCSDGGIPKAVCRATWSLWSAHRPERIREETFFPHKNFGTVDIRWRPDSDDPRPEVDPNGPCAFDKMTVSVRDARGDVAFSLERDSCASVGVVLPSPEEAATLALPWAYQSFAARATAVASLLLSAAAALELCRRMCRRACRRTSALGAKPKTS